MRTTTRQALALTTALTMAVALGACGSGDDGDDGGDESGSSSAEIRVWLSGADTPQEARDYLKTTFEDENPGATLRLAGSAHRPVTRVVTHGGSQPSYAVVEELLRARGWQP